MLKLIPERHQRLVRFLLTGALNTAFGYCCFAALIFIGLHYTLAVLLGTIIGVLFNFFTTGKLVFDMTDHHRLPRFFAVYAILYILNVLWLKLMVMLNVDLYLGGAIAILPMAGLSYFLNSRLVFHHET